jgi:cytochrome c oxidase cbb3-type subunit 3
MRSRRRIAALALLLASGPLPGCSGEPDPGTRVWRKKCAACHGRDGAGKTRFAEGRPFADLTDGRWKHGEDRESIRRLVADGDPKSTMPPFNGTLTPEEIEAVVDHVLNLAPGSPAEVGP